ncbi:unnamed protein product, partial [Protopolystoma xenopodis]
MGYEAVGVFPEMSFEALESVLRASVHKVRQLRQLAQPTGLLH